MVRRSTSVRAVGLACRRAALFGVIVAMVTPACAGRSRSDENDGQPSSVPHGDGGGNVPTGGSSSTGGSFPTGGTLMTGGTGADGGIQIGGTAGVAAMGGTSACGSGSPGGIPAGTGGLAPPNSDPECEGIRTNTPCALEGKLCVDLACGPGDSGRRECACAVNWTCSACSNTGGFPERPVNILPCPSAAADGVACTGENTVCGPVVGEYCACARSPVGSLIWDCACPPSTWGP